MHALPTPENIAMVIANMPLQKCRVSAAWKSRGCLSDVLTIDALITRRFLELQTTFFNVVPFDMVEIPDPKDQHLLRQHLTCPTTLHLVGFLAHYLYWTVLRPLATYCAAIQSASMSSPNQDPPPSAATSAPPKRPPSHHHLPPASQAPPPAPTLTPTDIEQLLVSTTESFASIKSSLAASIPITTTRPTPPLLPLFVLSLRVTIDTIFRTTYPKWMDENSLRIEPTLLALSHVVDQLLDPHGYYDRIGPLEASADAINFTKTQAFKMQKRGGPRLRESFFATSTTMQSIMPTPSSGGPRRLLLEGGGGRYHRNHPQKPSTSPTKEGQSFLSVGNRLKLLKLREHRGSSA
ncbi:hypothetical protein B5M09_007633 [Aphanomyces astaci]|uniref:Uncharacterized protein n=1 Tax=Aphanomyces astaci TaxID=112090 RepID=A0A3R7XVD4_APHAT|nr:hypothetical protein B5M09_007633 [Aphanomyces astaci]